MIPLRKAVSVGVTVAFIALVMLVLAYSLPIIIQWPLVVAIIYLLMLYSIFYPAALPMIRPSIAYFGYIPASFFGLEVSIIFWLNRFGMLVTHVLLGSILVAFFMLSLFHYGTRQGLVIHRKFLYSGLGVDLKKITRVGEIFIAPLFLVMSTTFSSLELGQPSLGVLIVVSSVVGLYLIFSVSGLNVTYRTRLLNRKLGTKDFTSKVEHLETALLKKYPQKSDTVEFFSFVLRSAVDEFAYGDYERSFLDAYRVVHDKILDEPKAIVESKADEKTLDEYRRIRVFLIHGFLHEKKSKLGVPIQIGDVIWARKVLFQKAVDLIDLAFYVAAQI